MRPARELVGERVVDVLRGSTRPLVVATREGRFVVKLVHGAEGPESLAAEWVCGHLASVLGLPSLEVAIVQIDPARGRDVLDTELRETIERGAGPCFGVRELSGARAATWRELQGQSDDFALPLLAFDTWVENPDRRVENPNVLVHGASLVPIDHGSALPFHRGWRITEDDPRADLAVPHGHMYQSRAPQLYALCNQWRALRTPLVTRAVLDDICSVIPEPWLGPIIFESAERQRIAYAAYLWKRWRALLTR